MPYTLTRRANHTVEVAAELDADAVGRERATIVQEFRRRARVPGFRPGRAPEAAVRARFAADIQAELSDQLTGLLLREMLDGEEGLLPLTKPRLGESQFSDDGGFRFTAEMEVRPRYELPDLAGAELPEVTLEVTADEIDRELERVAEEHASWEPADDAAASDGMLVEADLHGEAEGQEPYHEHDARFILGHESVPKPITDTLQGVRVGERRVAERRFEADEADPQSAGKTGKTVSYTIDVKALKRKLVPAVDLELARTIGYESLDELRARISELLARNKRIERREQWRRFLLDRLELGIDPNQLPPSLVSAAVREDVNRFAYTMAMQGMAPNADQVDWRQLAARLEPGARRRVLDMLVLEQLADQWQIAVPEGEVDAVVAAEAARLGIPPGEHKANLAKEDGLEGLRHAARISATTDEMIRRAGGGVESC